MRSRLLQKYPWVALGGVAAAVVLAFRLSPSAFAAPERVGAGPAAWANDLTPIPSAEWSDDRAAHLLERGGSARRRRRSAAWPR